MSGSTESRTAEERWMAMGRGLERLLELASADPALADGLSALLETATLALAERRAPASAASTTPVMAEAPAPASTDAEPAPAAEMIEPDAEAPAPTIEPPAPSTLPEPEPALLSRADLLGAIDAATRLIEIERAQHAADTRDDPFARSQAPDTTSDGEERDLPLQGIATRTRLRADVSRAAAVRARTGAEVDDGLIHRARSEGAAVWMLDLPSPDPDALDRLAECLDAVGDAAELVTLLRRYEPTNLQRRAEAVKAVAAVQSALRISASELRRTEDEDQLAVFAWLRATTEAERIFVDRHMRLNDPLDPALLPEVVAPIREELEVLAERAERQELLRKRSQQLKYLAGQITKGRATPRDTAKLLETVVALVEGGLPPTSLLFRELLLPVLDQLPSADDAPAAYGRVIAALDEHRDRLSQAPAPTSEFDEEDERIGWVPGRISAPSDAVRLAREHLGRVVIPESAVEHIAELDSTPNAAAWGRSYWRALRALNTYAQESGWEGDFWDWCANSGHEHAWPATPKKLAMSESQTALTQYRDDRIFEVDQRVSDDGRILMQAHCKIAEGGGALSPRLYFHDDTDGPTGMIHVGFVGPHKYVRNASTN